MKYLSLFFIVNMAINSKVYANELKTPECLKANTAFWKDIMTEYGEKDLVIHNRETFEIYEVITLENLEDKTQLKEVMEELKEELEDEEYSQIRVQTGIKEKFAKGEERSRKHLKSIKRIFKKRGIPEQIAYLPHVESSFDEKAISKVGARGMWQVMPKTAKQFGVKKIKKLNEARYSTKIAAEILLDNYRVLKDWDLTVNAYHSGVRNLARGKEAVGSSDICKIIKEYNGGTYKFASKNYLGQFYAVLEIMEEKK